MWISRLNWTLTQKCWNKEINKKEKRCFWPLNEMWIPPKWAPFIKLLQSWDRLNCFILSSIFICQCFSIFSALNRKTFAHHFKSQHSLNLQNVLWAKLEKYHQNLKYNLSPLRSTKCYFLWNSFQFEMDMFQNIITVHWFKSSVLIGKIPILDEY